ncbi:MAG TPA: asparaginase [Clostridia bacterium]|nr:asparaginase [Clostridia bacterium]
MNTSKVVIISTGGTIAMRYDPVQKGVFPAVTGQELVEAIPPLVEVYPIEVYEFSNIPSPHMTPQLMLKLAQKVEQILATENVRGIVITHGTDTLEETAYFLSLILQSNKPVCLTAAMRSSAEISPDGPKNVLDAVRTAAASEASGKGVMVVMNQEIHSARDVTKTHTASIDTFKSPFWGPIGYVDEDRILFQREVKNLDKIITNRIIEDVYLVKLAAGSDDFLIQALVDKEVKGIVVEGLGRGNIPPAVIPGIKRAIHKKIPVVLATRVPMGRVLDIYGYEGGAKPLKEMGVIFAGELSGQKARIKLMLALSKTNCSEELVKYF